MQLGAPASNLRERVRNLSYIILCSFCRMYNNSSYYVIHLVWFIPKLIFKYVTVTMGRLLLDQIIPYLCHHAIETRAI